jgi:uncharacterized membrane protein
MRLNYIGWMFFILFAVVIGLYPLSYLFFDMSGSLLSSKTQALLQSRLWNTAFYLHISFGGLSLLTGWSQFSKWLRNKNLSVHRIVGKIYLISVSVSGSAALYITFFATGGVVPALGFAGLAIAWLTSSSIAYIIIRKGNIDRHQQWMVRSYALTFAAVTLRLWIPVFQGILHMDFITSYKIIAWLCWVPNLIIGDWIARRLAKRNASNKLIRQL